VTTIDYSASEVMPVALLKYESLMQRDHEGSKFNSPVQLVFVFKPRPAFPRMLGAINKPVEHTSCSTGLLAASSVL
jgi:hypothetical protein